MLLVNGKPSCMTRCMASRSFPLVVTEEEPVRSTRQARSIGSASNADGEWQAFLYDPEQGIQQLSLGGNGGSVNAINEAGQVMGSSTTATGEDWAFFYDPNLGIQELSLGGNWSVPDMITESGYVTGRAPTTPGSNEGFLYLYHPSIGIQEIGLAGETVGVNEAGQAIGSTYFAAGERMQAFVYDPVLGIQKLSLGGDSGLAAKMTESGYGVGHSTNAAGETHAFLYHQSFGLQTLSLGGTGDRLKMPMRPDKWLVSR